MKNFVQPGKVLTLTAPRTGVSGECVKVGSIVGVAENDFTSGADVVVDVLGVFDIAKDTSTFSAGDVVYWDDTAHKATSTATSNTKIGVAIQAQVTGDTTVRTRLSAAF